MRGMRKEHNDLSIDFVCFPPSHPIPPLRGSMLQFDHEEGKQSPLTSQEAMGQYPCHASLPFLYSNEVACLLSRFEPADLGGQDIHYFRWPGHSLL